MLFGLQKNLRWYQIALMPVAVPVLVAGLTVFAVPAVVGAVRDRLRHGFWG